MNKIQKLVDQLKGLIIVFVTIMLFISALSAIEMINRADDIIKGNVSVIESETGKDLICQEGLAYHNHNGFLVPATYHGKAVGCLKDNA